MEPIDFVMYRTCFQKGSRISVIQFGTIVGEVDVVGVEFIVALGDDRPWILDLDLFRCPQRVH